MSCEFSFVVWGSSVTVLRTGVSTADGTLLASLFVVGMFAGRIFIGSGFGSGRSSLALLAAGFCVVLVGAGLTWVATTPALSGLGLFLGGCGVACLWPVGVSVAVHTAGVGQLQAAARATLGSGLAILVAPAALGLAADAVGVVAAWPIILGMAACGLGVVFLAGRVEPGERSPA